MQKKKRFIYYSSPEHWLQSALELNSAIEELFLIRDKAFYTQVKHFEKETSITRPAYSRATYLLMAYSLENLLKGIAVLNNPNFVNTGKIHKKIRTHDLNSLAELNNFELQQVDIDFQSILTAQCCSNARYPVGLNDNTNLSDPSISKEDQSTYNNLFQKYKNHLVESFNKMGWDSGLGDPNLKTDPGEFVYWEL